MYDGAAGGLGKRISGLKEVTETCQGELQNCMQGKFCPILRHFPHNKNNYLWV